MSQYIDLISKLSEQDKKIITNYISKYGVRDKFIGVDEWLQNWSHSNQKLYHLLGDSFIKEYPYQYEKTSEILHKEVSSLLLENNFKRNYHDFYFDYIKKAEYLSTSDINWFNHLLDKESFIYNQIDFTLKIKKPNAKKILQIQAGTKILKAIGRVVEYFKDDYDFDLKAFEDLKVKYGILISEKIVEGKFCISIHPMDYLTMSDNNSNWTSCMSWQDDGCYHVGTIEMMNSNNVICCYLLSGDTKYYFNTKHRNGTMEETYTWNNKRWRQLFYITKDIVMGGKPYPYVSEELTKSILEQLTILAKDNLNWTYKFGPELYKDMIHVNNNYHMDNQRMWMQFEKKKPIKHNIIWDTQGMYNDMLNDSRTEYWCYRNKVNHTKVISISGKANCLCCNEPIIEYNDCNDDYNDRYYYTSETVCQDCLNLNFKCNCCGSYYTRGKLYNLVNGDKICKDCLDNYVRICPCCGKVYYRISSNIKEDEYCYNNFLYDLLKSSEKYPDKYRKLYTNYMDMTPSKIKESLEYFLKEGAIEEKKYGFSNAISLEVFNLHDECYDKIIKEFEKDCQTAKFKRIWGKNNTILKIVNPKIAEKYRNMNLEIPDYNSIVVPDSSSTT